MGLITTWQQAEDILINEKADLIFMAREMLRDPYFPRRASIEMQESFPWPDQYERADPLKQKKMMIEISKLIKQRRTTKPSKMKAGSRVPDAVIMEALENATWAPNHGKTEPWFFVVYSGEGLVNFCNAQADLYQKESGDNFNPAKLKNLQGWADTVSHLIAICHRRSILTKIPELEEIEAIACGVQNLALTIEAHGYAGMWSTGGITYYESARELLGFSDHERLLGFFLVGEKMEESAPASRRPIHEKIRWVSS